MRAEREDAQRLIGAASSDPAAFGAFCARERLGMPSLILDDHASETISRLADEELASLALSELPPDQREAIRARVLNDRDYQEIAASAARRPSCASASAVAASGVLLTGSPILLTGTSNPSFGLGVPSLHGARLLPLRIPDPEGGRRGE